MTSHVARLYAAAGALAALFLAWAGIAAQPWATAPRQDPQAATLAAREQRLRHDAVLVRRVVARRWAEYRAALAQQRAAAQAPAAPAPAPSVRVVTLPPLVSTRTS